MQDTVKTISLYFLSMNKKLPCPVLQKLIYLVDYFYARQHGKQYSAIKWYYDKNGPYSQEVEIAITDNSSVSIQRQCGHPSIGSYFVYSGAVHIIQDEDLLIVLQHVQGLYTESHGYNDFILYVYSTSPLRKTQQYEYIDIVAAIKKEADELLEETWEETVKVYGEVLTALAE